jgi:hypothetical protein
VTGVPARVPLDVLAVAHPYERRPPPDQREVGGHGPFDEGGDDGRALRYPGGGQPADQPDLDDAGRP